MLISEIVRIRNVLSYRFWYLWTEPGRLFPLFPVSVLSYERSFAERHESDIDLLV